MNIEDKEFKEGERLYFGHGEKEEERAHKERYDFAREKLGVGAVVLDAACGSGYGSEILARQAKSVIGLEIDDHALRYAKSHHQKHNIEFKKANLNKKLDLPDKFFDAVVSFETLEHVANQELMISEFQRVLKPGGVLIISTPDREIISDKAAAENKFHVAELSKKEFIDLISRFFDVEMVYGQIKYKIPAWWKKLIKLFMNFFPRRLKRFITDAFHLQRFVHKTFAPQEMTSITRIDPEEENQYFHLIIVAKSK